MMRYLFGLGLLLVIAGCGTIATPPYQATAMIREAQGTATAIVAQANTQAFASPTMTETPTQTPSMTPTLTNTPAPSNTPTPIPTDTPNPTATEEPSTSSDVPSNALEQIEVANAENGQVLFNTFQPAASFACSTCHRADSEERLIGPGLLNVSVRAENRVEGLDAGQYIYQSIINPSAYVVDGFPDQLMPQNWADIYSDEEIFDIIAYLFTLTE